MAFVCECGKSVGSQLARHQSICTQRTQMIACAKLFRSMIDAGACFPPLSPDIDFSTYKHIHSLVFKNQEQTIVSLSIPIATPQPGSLTPMTTGIAIAGPTFAEDIYPFQSERWSEISLEETREYIADPMTVVMRLVRLVRANPRNRNFFLATAEGDNIVVKTHSGQKRQFANSFFTEYVEGMIARFNTSYVEHFDIYAQGSRWDIYCNRITNNENNMIEALGKAIVHYLRTEEQH